MISTTLHLIIEYMLIIEFLNKEDFIMLVYYDLNKLNIDLHNLDIDVYQLKLKIEKHFKNHNEIVRQGIDDEENFIIKILRNIF
jgi:hypothetical protein